MVDCGGVKLMPRSSPPALPICIFTERAMVSLKSVLFCERACSRLMQGPMTLVPMPEPSSIVWLRMPNSETFSPDCSGRPRPSEVLFFSRTAPSASCLRPRSMPFWIRARELPVPSALRTSEEGL